MSESEPTPDLYDAVSVATIAAATASCAASVAATASAAAEAAVTVATAAATSAKSGTTRLSRLRAVSNPLATTTPEKCDRCGVLKKRYHPGSVEKDRSTWHHGESWWSCCHALTFNNPQGCQMQCPYYKQHILEVPGCESEF